MIKKFQNSCKLSIFVILTYSILVVLFQLKLYFFILSTYNLKWNEMPVKTGIFHFYVQLKMEYLKFISFISSKNVQLNLERNLSLFEYFLLDKLELAYLFFSANFLMLSGLSMYISVYPHSGHTAHLIFPKELLNIPFSINFLAFVDFVYMYCTHSI